MDANQAHEWVKKLELQVKWVWWDFQPKHVFEGPYWYVEAVNKINGKKHKLWNSGDEKVLFGPTVHTGNINSPEEACVYLAGSINQLKGVEKNPRERTIHEKMKNPIWSGDSESISCQWCGRIGKRMLCHGQDLMFCVHEGCPAYDVPFTPEAWHFLGEMMGKSSLHQQVDELAKFILSLDCGYPTVNEEFPNGMSATEAAIAYIKELSTTQKGDKK